MRVVTRTRQVDEPRQIHDQPLRSTLGDLEAWLGLVVTRKPAGVGGILVDADVHPVLPRLERLEDVRAGLLPLVDAAAHPAAPRVAEAGEVRWRLRIEGLTIESQLERDARPGRGRNREHGYRQGHGDPGRSRAKGPHGRFRRMSSYGAVK